MKSQLKIVLVICAGLLLSACNKKVKDVDANANVGNTTTENTGDQGTGIVTEGAYSPADLESNSCLKTRVIYFDFDQELLKP